MQTRKAILLPLVFSVVLMFLPFSPLVSEDSEWLKSRMEKRLQELIDERMDDFYREMIVRESYLTYLIKSINREIRLRTKEGIPVNPEDLDEAMGVPVNLIQDYQKELSRVLALYDELTKLEKQAGRRATPELMRKMSSLKARLADLLGAKTPASSAIYDAKTANRLIEAYSNELMRLVEILRELKRLQAKAPAARYREQIAQLEKEVGRYLDISLPATSTYADRYMQETMKVVEVLRQLDALDRQTPPARLELHLKIRKVKDSLLRSVDRRALLALGYRNIHYYADRKRLEEYFEEWQAQQILWYRAKVQQAEFLRRKLLESATAEQRRRMFEADVLYAAEQFNNGNFGLAERLFRNILNLYSPANSEEFRYYLAESIWQQHRPFEAVQLYREIAQKVPGTDIAHKSLYRLMMHAERFRQYLRFFSYADQLIREMNGQKNRHFPEEVALYAAFVANQLGRIQKSETYLAEIPQSSPVFAQAKFLHAENLIQKGETAKAVPVLRALTERKGKALLRESRNLQDQARFKLALIFYKQGDLLETRRLLQDISPGADGYDAVIMARAWTEFRLGNLQKAADELDLLLWNDFTSPYFYEAMMLSAHCNRLLGNLRSAIRKVRYVENAKKMRRLSGDILQEKERLQRVLSQLENLEAEVVTAGDIPAYEQVMNLKRNVILALQAIAYHGDPGLQPAREAQDEEQRITDLISQLKDYERISRALGNRTLTKRIRKTLRSLSDDLVRARRLQIVGRVDVFADYPLAQEESKDRYKAARVRKMKRQVAEEKRQLAAYKQELRQLIRKAREKNNLDALSRLEYRGASLADLEKRLEVFSVYLQESDTPPPETDFTQWADFSGFGMSDLDFVRMRTIDHTVAQRNDLIGVINETIRRQQRALQKKIALLDDRIDALEKEELRKKIRREQDRRRRYFEEQYFVRKTSELKPVRGIFSQPAEGEKAAAADSSKANLKKEKGRSQEDGKE